MLLQLPLTILLFTAPGATPEPPRKIEVTEAMVQKYAPVRQRILERTIAFYRQLKQEEAQRRDAGKQATLAQLDDLRKRGKAHDEAMKKLELDSGLSPAEWKETGRLFEEVGTERTLWRMGDGDEGIAKTEASMADALAKLTEAQRAQVLDQMTGGRRRAKTAERSRKTWGSALVDLVLKVGEPLELQRMELFKVGVVRN
jgi:hypothetical protein